ncbi:MAG: pitrilysin family protein [Bacteroidota bacterium]
MKILNRNIAPEFKLIDELNIIHPTKIEFPNRIPVYIFNSGSEDLLKIELVFNAGTCFQKKSLVASACNSMLTEGTKKRSSKQVSEDIDYYGAYLSTDIDKDFASINLYSLKKYLPQTLEILDDIIKNPIFDENELKVYLENNKQSFQINSNKVSYVARMKFNEALFGKNHPYGKNAELADFEKVTKDDINSFYKAKYNSNNCLIIISGKASEKDLALINDYFGKSSWGGKFKKQTIDYSITTNSKKRITYPKTDALQAAIRIGKVMMNRNHEDYLKLQVLVTLFGGYFGSRLMKNIREDKGYTYGIGAGLVSHKNVGYMYIGSEVGVDVCEKAIDEVYYEMNRLKTDIVDQAELDLVKNYLLGVLLKSFDGVFQTSEKYKTIILNELEYNYYERFVDIIKKITPEDINIMANKYFTQDEMVEIVAGNI